MTTKEVCKRLNKPEWKIYELAGQLGIKNIERKNHYNWTNLDFARLKAGIYYKDYVWVEGINQHRVYYALSYINEIKIEI